jgi:hypothetical protein
MKDRGEMDGIQNGIAREIQDSLDTLLKRILQDEKTPYRQDLINVLKEGRKVLSEKRLHPKRLERVLFGIARVVSDDSNLETSPLGQDLLALSNKMVQVKQMLQQAKTLRD